jgi:signal transduction histidine kinase
LSSLLGTFHNAKDILLEKEISEPWIKVTLTKKANKAIITIEDNGGGIPAKVLPRVFDPYFTTKHESTGTGLGLHMSYKMVTESLQGKLYASNSDYGALFTIELPLKSEAKKITDTV